MDGLVHVLGQLVLFERVVALVELVVVDASVHAVEVVLELVVLADARLAEGFAVRVDLLHEVVAVAVHARGVALRAVVRVPREVQVLHPQLLHHLRVRVPHHLRALVEELVPFQADLHEHLPQVVVFLHVLLRALQLLAHHLHLLLRVREERVQTLQQADQLEDRVPLDVRLALDALDLVDHRAALLLEELCVFLDVRVGVRELGLLQDFSAVVQHEDFVCLEVFAVVESLGLRFEHFLGALVLVSRRYLLVIVEVVDQPRGHGGCSGLAHLEVALELFQLDLRELLAVADVFAQLFDVVLARSHPGVDLILHLFGRPDLVDEHADLAPGEEDAGEGGSVAGGEVVHEEDGVADLPPVLEHLPGARAVEEVLEHLDFERLRGEVFEREEEDDHEVVQTLGLLVLALLREPRVPRRTGRSAPWTSASSSRISLSTCYSSRSALRGSSSFLARSYRSPCTPRRTGRRPAKP